MAGQCEAIGINPKRASLRNNYQKFNNLLDSSYPPIPPLSQCTKKDNNVISELENENSKRKRRESHELSGGSAKEGNRSPTTTTMFLNVPKVPNLSPTSLKLANMDTKKCKVETERERLYRVSEVKVKFIRKQDED